MHIEIIVDGKSLIKVDTDQLSLKSAPNVPAAIPESIGKSTPMIKAQARELLSMLDSKSTEFLNRLAQNNGSMSWKNMRPIFGIKDKDDWEAYYESYGEGITQAFRHMLQDKSARLVWRNSKDWYNNEWDSDMCAVFVDGPALHALRQAVGLVGLVD